MNVIFKPENHSYESTSGESIDWISVTTFIGNFKEPFDARSTAERVSKSRKSKWYKLPVQEILDVWNNESRRSIELGTWYHDQRERDLTSHQTIERHGKELPIVKPVYIGGIKHAPDQKLREGIYPEHFVYLKSAGLCGQSDLVEVVNGYVHITDYKTNKEIKSEGFKDWDKNTKKMLRPMHHLDDCNLNHYNLQLSLYMYMILKHNPRLYPGNLILHHILFEEQARDKYDNPIYKKDAQGNFIVKDIVPYELPYLRSECISLINWLYDNRSQIKRKAA